MPIVFNTATSVNGYLADLNDSLEWLFEVPGEQTDMQEFLSEVAVLVMGSTTYEWVLRHENILAAPHKWQLYFGSRPTYVFTSRELPTPEGADVRFIKGAVSDHLAEIRSTAGERTAWVQGGGDLAGQFLDAGALESISIAIAPVFLQDGRRLFPRDLHSDRLTLTSAVQVGQFVVANYAVSN